MKFFNFGNVKGKVNVIQYTRISSDTQELNSQSFACVTYANNNRLNITSSFEEIASARNFQNLKILNTVIRGKNICILVYALDRLSRNFESSKWLIDIFNINNIKVYTVVDGNFLNLRTSEQERNTFLEKIRLAELESNQISERVKRSIEYRRHRGEYIGRVPYGYTTIYVPENTVNMQMYKLMYGRQVYEQGDGNKRVLTLNREENCIIHFIKMLCKRKCRINEVTNILEVHSISFNKIVDKPIRIVSNIDDDSDFGFDLEEYTYLSYQNQDQDNNNSVINSYKKIRFTPKMIAEILNDYNILYKNGNWTSDTVKYINKRRNLL